MKCFASVHDAVPSTCAKPSDHFTAPTIILIPVATTSHCSLLAPSKTASTYLPATAVHCTGEMDNPAIVEWHFGSSSLSVSASVWQMLSGEIYWVPSYLKQLNVRDTIDVPVVVADEVPVDVPVDEAVL